MSNETDYLISLLMQNKAKKKMLDFVFENNSDADEKNFGRGGTECCLGAISQMATYCSHTGGQAERADKISDIVYSER